jgi:hypothetical protein
VEEMKSVDENDILLFQGVWSQENGEQYELMWTKDYMNLGSWNIGDIGDFDSTIMFFVLHRLGISFDVIDSLIPKLYKVYERRIRESQSPEYYDKFKEKWDWRSFRDQLAEMRKKYKSKRHSVSSTES